MKELLEKMLGIANAAGSIIMEVYQNNHEVEFKEDLSPVTKADQASHAFIAREINSLSQRYPVLSEEDVKGFTGWQPGGFYWLVDPLDGTKEFISENGEFTVNIALIKNDAPVLGVVTAPALGVAYVAAQGLGAFKVDIKGQYKRISVSNKARDSDGLRVVSSRHHHTAALEAWLTRLKNADIRPVGSSLKFCLIAEGLADVYPRFGPTGLWDTAAAQVIVEEAGGVVETMEGGPLRYGDPSQVINPSFVVWGSRPC